MQAAICVNQSNQIQSRPNYQIPIETKTWDQNSKLQPNRVVSKLNQSQPSLNQPQTKILQVKVRKKLKTTENDQNRE